MHEFASLKLA